MRREFTATVPPRSMLPLEQIEDLLVPQHHEGIVGAAQAPTAPVIEHVPPIPAATCTVPAPV